MFMSMFNPFYAMEQYSNFFFPTLKKKEQKIDHTNAKYKVVKATTFEEVFYSNAPTKEKARKEGWAAFNIKKETITKGYTGVDLIVVENPHRIADAHNNDLVTGLPVK